MQIVFFKNIDHLSLKPEKKDLEKIISLLPSVVLWGGLINITQADKINETQKYILLQIFYHNSIKFIENYNITILLQHYLNYMPLQKFPKKVIIYVLLHIHYDNSITTLFTFYTNTIS